MNAKHLWQTVTEHRVAAAIIGINLALSMLLWCEAGISWLRGTPLPDVGRWLVLPASWAGWLNRPWTLLTYMVTHYSPLHLLFNMLCLYAFAPALGRDSNRRTLLLYLCGGLAGGCAFIGAASANIGPGGKLCGASAAVLAVIAAAAILNPGRHMTLWPFGVLKLTWVAIALIAITLLGSPGAWAPHLAGVAAGTAIAFALKYSSQNSVIHKVKVTAQPVADTPPAATSRDARLDQLLDKIRLSGFDSLSRAEKEELKKMSSKI